VGFEPTIPASEQTKTVHAVHRAATVTSTVLQVVPKIKNAWIYSSALPYACNAKRQLQLYLTFMRKLRRFWTLSIVLLLSKTLSSLYFITTLRLKVKSTQLSPNDRTDPYLVMRWFLHIQNCLRVVTWYPDTRNQLEKWFLNQSRERDT
jgi:hypothetical protein